MRRKDLCLFAGVMLFLLLMLSVMFFSLIEGGCFDPVLKPFVG
jgi:hypothetical protein